MREAQGRRLQGPHTLNKRKERRALSCGPTTGQGCKLIFKVNKTKDASSPLGRLAKNVSVLSARLQMAACKIHYGGVNVWDSCRQAGLVAVAWRQDEQQLSGVPAGRCTALQDLQDRNGALAYSQDCNEGQSDSLAAAEEVKETWRLASREECAGKTVHPSVRIPLFFTPGAILLITPPPKEGAATDSSDADNSHAHPTRGGWVLSPSRTSSSPSPLSPNRLPRTVRSRSRTKCLPQL
ncbi:hypothetical protein SKAU_G00035210 [Synaphobranchus kaupii]|uniref:Uncharacterized protein n=1 Tax=Synaphobranchus kaupii TaxID=118154 RepID=A0A9Q1GFU3_SYNKA|nr:hypothetical protein SKAU_G00035210 [Synaphobranchus kaupii]